VSLQQCESDDTKNTLISYTNTSLLGRVDFKSDSLELIPETEILEVGDESIDSHSLEHELTPETLDILASIETFDEYFHCCGRW
jgi:hypothetical protein